MHCKHHHHHESHEGHGRRSGFFGRGRWHGGGGGGGPFGIRRPLRFLAHKLDLDEEQVSKFAAILDDLKTERAQAHVDGRRATKLYAESVSGAKFDAKAAKAAAKQRVDSLQRVQDAVVTALGELFEVLEPDQRERLSLLIRTGPLTL